jgi:ABC-2 type transport system ATP-binding protein
VDRATQRITVPVTGGADEMLDRARLLSEQHVALADVALRRPTLDDVFLALTGHHAESRTDDGAETEAELAGDAA